MRTAGRSKASAAIALLVAGCGVFAALGAGGCRGRPRTEPAPAATAASSSASSGWRSDDPDPYGAHVAELDLSRGVPESGTSSFLGAPSKRTLAEATKLLTDIRQGREKQIKGLLVLFGSMTTGYSRAQELGDGLAAVRDAGLPVVCHADELTNASYWIAARGCDRIWISPAGGVETVGLGTELVYVRRMLGELQVDVDMLQVGKFKGAAEPLTRDGPSDEARASMLDMLGSVRDSWLSGVAKGRPGKDLAGSLESGPWSPHDAVERGLIDGVGYDTDARADARARAGQDNVVTRFGAGAKTAETPGIVSIVRLLSGAGEGTGAPHVAVIRATGAISMGGSPSLFGESDGIARTTLGKTLEKVRKDESVRAVVIRIDSPGGSALASDLLWSDLMALRGVKPLVFSVGDMAASGGYYLACAATRIFAQPSSIVGSIGVVGGKLSVHRSLDRVGIHTEVLPASSASGASARVGYSSPFNPWDDDTRARMLSSMTSVYDLFVSRVAQGRGLPPDRVATFAEGRLHAAREGVGLGMVDELGGLQDAISYARRAGGLAEDAPAYLVVEESGLVQALGLDDPDAQERASGRMAEGSAARILMQTMAPGLMSFAASFEPMIRGEHTLVAVPFGFLVR